MTPRPFTIAALLLLTLTPAARGEDAPALKFPDSQIEPLTWNDLDGWADDDHAAAFTTFLASCQPLARGRGLREARPVRAALGRSAGTR